VESKQTGKGEYLQIKVELRSYKSGVWEQKFI